MSKRTYAGMRRVCFRDLGTGIGPHSKVAWSRHDAKNAIVRVLFDEYMPKSLGQYGAWLVIAIYALLAIAMIVTAITF